MSDEGNIAACAGLVARGDPARFRAVMAAPVSLRSLLFPLYAFNLEVARAPWVTQEPLIAEMRLQWWRDALEEISAGGAVRRHEVATPLASLLDADGARDLDDLVEARRDDIGGPHIGSIEELARYLDRTAGTLLWTAARLAGATDEAAARDAGLAQGAAAWLRAAPELAEKGRQPLPPGEPADQSRAVAELGLAALLRFRRTRVARSVRPVYLVLSDTGAELRAVARHPECAPKTNPILSRVRLAWQAMT